MTVLDQGGCLRCGRPIGEDQRACTPCWKYMLRRLPSRPDLILLGSWPLNGANADKPRRDLYQMAGAQDLRGLHQWLKSHALAQSGPAVWETYNATQPWRVVCAIPVNWSEAA